MTLTEQFIQIIFGWPGIVTAILLSILGVSMKKPIMLMIAGIICLPFTYYISNGLRSPLVVLPLLEFVSAYAITRQKNGLAWLLIVPLIAVSTALAFVVISQFQ